MSADCSVLLNCLLILRKYAATTERRINPYRDLTLSVIYKRDAINILNIT